MNNANIFGITLSKNQLMKYLGIGKTTLERILQDEKFPKVLPNTTKWSRPAIDAYLVSAHDTKAKEQSWHDFI